ncbi:MAG: hypothetical protein U9R16_02580 [Campylobacterota bacterium]|nr:hypothetical protein [Campylobacterota bacterium]
MKKILILMIVISSLAFSSVVVNQPIKNFNLPDQFGNIHKIKNSTTKVIFAFKKASGHTVKDFVATKDADYLSKRDILFVADVSAMPSFIKFFVLPITGYDYPIVTLDNDELSDYYKNKGNEEKIMVVILNNMNVVDIKYIENVSDLQKEIEKEDNISTK